MAKPTIQSHNISPTGLDTYASQILASMKKNRDIYETPDPDLDELEIALLEFRKAIADAAYRDKRAILIRDNKQAALLDIIRLLSLYVTKVARGDRNLILAAGFIPSKEPQPTGATPKPHNLRAIPEIGSNAVKLRVKPWKPARVYQFEYRRKADGEPWQVCLSFKSTCTIEKLERFVEYEFRVAYITAKPDRIYSNVVSCYVV